MNKKQNNAKKSFIKKQLAAQRGLDRKYFFENGGELNKWRGIHHIQIDKKKSANKKACRGKQYG